MIGGDVNIHNRPNWNRPGWGWGWGPGWNRPGNWHAHWHNRWSHRHPWYNGCWHGNWAGVWTVPVGINVGFWGLQSVSSGWSTNYVNPYYTASSTAFDYSQPVVINNFVTAEGGDAISQSEAQASAANEAAARLVDEALVFFRDGNYRQAVAKTDAALRQVPDDPVIHEVRALALFAQGNFKEAAAALNALLAVAPGMDWTTMSSLYDDVDTYTTQLRALEAHVRANPNDAAAAFVLAYHYLVLGETDAAVHALRTVVKLEPSDTVAARMLEMLAPPADATQAVTTTEEAADLPETDLVGKWIAKAPEVTIELSIDEQSQFTWRAIPKGEEPIELSGDLLASSDMLILDTEEKGSMAGRVVSGGADQFQFLLAGAPPTDEGLKFVRVK